MFCSEVKIDSDGIQFQMTMLIDFVPSEFKREFPEIVIEKSFYG